MDTKMESKTQQNMISCILEAPSFENSTKSSTHVAHLFRSEWYQIKLKKINPRVIDDKLVVDFHLGLNANFVSYNGKTEQNLMKKWKSLHPNERLVDIKFQDDSDEKNEMQYTQDKDQPVDAVKLCWNKRQEIKLNIRFDCVSSQFDSIGHYMLDSILLLHANVSSQTTSKLIESLYCQIRLDWLGNVENETLISNFAKFESFEPDQLPEFYPEMSPEPTLGIGENDKLFDQTCLKHFLQDPITPFYDISNAKYVKTIFVQQNQGFTFKMISDFENGKLVITKIKLTLDGRPFDEDELYEWSQTAQTLMIEPNFESSKMSSEVRDVRVTKPCEIEVIWLTSRDFQEMILSFKVNHVFSDPKVPFLVTIKSYLKDFNVKIGYAEVKIYSEKQEMIFEGKQKETFVKGILKQTRQLIQQIQKPLEVVKTNFKKITDDFNVETKLMQNFMLDKNKEFSDFPNLVKNVERKMQQVKQVQSEMKIVENLIVKLTEFVLKFSQTDYAKSIEPNLDLIVETYAIDKNLTLKQKMDKISDMIKNRQIEATVLLNEIEQLFSQLINSKNCDDHLLKFLSIDRSKNHLTEYNLSQTSEPKKSAPISSNWKQSKPTAQHKLLSTKSTFDQDNYNANLIVEATYIAPVTVDSEFVESILVPELQTVEQDNVEYEFLEPNILEPRSVKPNQNVNVLIEQEINEFEISQTILRKRNFSTYKNQKESTETTISNDPNVKTTTKTTPSLFLGISSGINDSFENSIVQQVKSKPEPLREKIEDADLKYQESFRDNKQNFNVFNRNIYSNNSSDQLRHSNYFGKVYDFLTTSNLENKHETSELTNVDYTNFASTSNLELSYKPNKFENLTFKPILNDSHLQPKETQIKELTIKNYNKTKIVGSQDWELKDEISKHRYQRTNTQQPSHLSSLTKPKTQNNFTTPNNKVKQSRKRFTNKTFIDICCVIPERK